MTERDEAQQHQQQQVCALSLLFCFLLFSPLFFFCWRQDVEGDGELAGWLTLLLLLVADAVIVVNVALVVIVAAAAVARNYMAIKLIELRACARVNCSHSLISFSKLKIQKK